MLSILRRNAFFIIYAWVFLIITTAWRILEPIEGFPVIAEYRYLIFAGYAVIAFLYSWLVIFLCEKLGRLPVIIMAATIVFSLVAAFIVIYPRVGVGADGFGDADDALNLIAGSLMSGHNPYELKTYLGNEISPMPGAGVIALPFLVFFGSSAYQNPFWLCCGLFFVHRTFSLKTALVSSLIILGSPGFLMGYLTGHDYFTSAIYLCLASAWIFHEISADKVRMPALVIASAAFSFACNSRLLTVPVFLVVLIYMVGKLGFVRSIPPLLAGACVWLGLLYPFFIAPGAFSPVRVGAMAGSQYIQAAIILASIGVILIWTFISRPRKSRAVEPWVPILGLSLCFIPVLISKPLQIARAAFFLIAGSPAMFSRLHDALESTDGKIFPAAKPGE